MLRGCSCRRLPQEDSVCSPQRRETAESSGHPGGRHGSGGVPHADGGCAGRRDGVDACALATSCRLSASSAATLRLSLRESTAVTCRRMGGGRRARSRGLPLFRCYLVPALDRDAEKRVWAIGELGGLSCFRPVTSHSRCQRPDTGEAGPDATTTGFFLLTLFTVLDSGSRRRNLCVLNGRGL